MFSNHNQFTSAKNTADWLAGYWLLTSEEIGWNSKVTFSTFPSLEDFPRAASGQMIVMVPVTTANIRYLESCPRTHAIEK